MKLLRSVLAAGQWRAPTVCPGWSVKDVALHLLGNDLDLLSRRRDGAAPADTPTTPAGFEELVASLDRLNQSWVDVARQDTERWTHHQQIRDGVGVPGLKEPAFMAPVLATFTHALPHAYTGVPAAAGRRCHHRLQGHQGRRQPPPTQFGTLPLRRWPPVVGWEQACAAARALSRDRFSPPVWRGEAMASASCRERLSPSEASDQGPHGLRSVGGHSPPGHREWLPRPRAPRRAPRPRHPGQ
jgi:Mycothiol maleylpyruvate isomerase N-terminal domain